jgi:hypothetical protein
MWYFITIRIMLRLFNAIGVRYVQHFPHVWRHSVPTNSYQYYYTTEPELLKYCSCIALNSGALNTCRSNSCRTEHYFSITISYYQQCLVSVHRPGIDIYQCCGAASFLGGSGSGSGSGCKFWSGSGSGGSGSYPTVQQGKIFKTN